MSRAADPPVGERIREERTKRGMSLRSLARDVGVSASLVSQIETGKCRPSVSTLYAITTTLGVSIEDVFQPASAAYPEAADSLWTARSATIGVVADSTATAVSHSSAVIAADEREVLRFDSGVTWERLGHVPGFQVDFLLVTYAPGGSSSSAGTLMRHPGAEYGYLIEGELILTLGPDEQHLMAGQSVSFTSAIPHRYRNDGAHPAVGVWFVPGRPAAPFSIR